MILKKTILLIQLLIFLSISLVIKGQPFYFRHFQVEKGLSNNTVFCCVQDRLGFMWFGTKDGLNRFDGYTFKIYRKDPSNPSGLRDNFIRSLYIDQSGKLYVGTRSGIYSFNQSDETFHEIIPSAGEVRSMSLDMNGNLWFVAGQTLTRWNENKREKHEYSPEKYFYATSVCTDSGNNIWASTTDGHLQKYYLPGDSFSSYNLFTESLPVTVKWIEKIAFVNNNTILAGTSNFGVKQFNLADLTVEDLLPHYIDKTEVFARDFILGNNNDLWIASEVGIFVYNLSDRKFHILKKNYNNPYALSDNAVYCLFKDREGGIWAGTYFGGINYFSGRYDLFQKYFPDNSPCSLSGNVVREICQDKNGGLWVGTEDAGLNKLDLRTGKFRQFRPTGRNTDISYSNIHGLMIDNNELWIGTFEHGLDIMDIRTGKVIKHFPGLLNTDQLKSNFIVTIYKTKNNDIYIGTRFGVYKYNKTLNSFNTLSQPTSYCFVHSMLEDHNNKLWIGTLDNGLFAFDPVSGKIEQFSHNILKGNSLPNNAVTTLFEDSEFNLWIGTEGGGLARFVPEANGFESVVISNNLSGSTIYKILEDNNRKLWITTSNGLIKMDPHDRISTLFTTENGLLTDQFNYNSGYKDPEGNLYFGSVKGLIRFNPERFFIDTLEPDVYITSFSINNRDVEAYHNKSPLDKSIISTENIELSYKQSSFSFTFSALSFFAPETNRYGYIMEEIDNDWITLDKNRRVYFTNLAPGNYTFKVKAANSNGIWSSKIKTLTIRIKPPLWANNWAYATYSTLLLLIVIYFFRTYFRRIAEKNQRKLELLQHQKEHEIYQAKLDFFTNVAHEIKTPLTLIKAPLERILEKSAGDKIIGGNLKLLERNTQRLIELINQLLDFRKIEKNVFYLQLSEININELLAERYASFKPFAEQKDILFTISLPQKAIFLKADADSIQKILNNLFYNALSYCNHMVEVILDTHEDVSSCCTIVFKNDGDLIPEGKREKVFDPFFRLGETRFQQGSGIGLALSRSLVLLHRGQLFFRDDSDGLNTFVLSIPVSIAQKD